MQGKIIKGIGGFYYIQTEELGLIECRAKGGFRREDKKPLVGDNVLIDILDEEKKLGNVVDILPRKNSLIRPAVANVDQALVIFAAASPAPNLNLLDRFLLWMKKQNVPTLICFNKIDIVNKEEIGLLEQTYLHCGFQVLFSSVLEKEGLSALANVMTGKTTVLAGPSGVGKSSLMNYLYPDANMITGEISQKIGRGKHTTRHSELFMVEQGTYIMDTPGFSSLYVNDFSKEEIKDYFEEFIPFEPYCKFQGCVHMKEPVCGIKDAVKEGKISKVRYENYCNLYRECEERRKW